MLTSYILFHVQIIDGAAAFSRRRWSIYYVVEGFGFNNK
jgi:hypothetical protein